MERHPAFNVRWWARDLANYRKPRKLNVLSVHERVVNLSVGGWPHLLMIAAPNSWRGPATLGLVEESFRQISRFLFTDYKIPTIENVPDIKSFVLETAEEGGPFGARGIGEPPMIGVAPAIANAVADAIGVDFSTFPITPERIVQALRDKVNKS